MKSTTLLKSLVQEMHNRRIPCHVSAYRTAAALLNDGSFDQADAVLMDASLLNSGMLMESLVRGALKQRLAIVGSTANEQMVRVLSAANVPCQPETEDARALCDALETLLLNSHDVLRRDEVDMLLDSLPLTMTLKGERYMEMALRLALRMPELMDRVKGGLYARVARRCGVSVSSVERDIRYAIARCWEQMEVRQKRTLLARCTRTPAPKLFLAQLLRRLRRRVYPVTPPDNLGTGSAPGGKPSAGSPENGGRQGF